jgi:hypothetical protein
MEDFLERHGNLEIEGKQVFESQEDEPIAMCLQVKMSEAILVLSSSCRLSPRCGLVQVVNNYWCGYW